MYTIDVKKTISKNENAWKNDFKGVSEQVNAFKNVECRWVWKNVDILWNRNNRRNKFAQFHATLLKKMTDKQIKVKFVFSKKATKIDEIFDTYCIMSNRQWRFSQFLWASYQEKHLQKVHWNKFSLGCMVWAWCLLWQHPNYTYWFK